MGEPQEGQIRISVSTLLDIVAKAAMEVEGVRSDFHTLLHHTKVLLGGENKSPHEKISLDEKGVVVVVPLKVAENYSFVAVARAVQKKTWNMVGHQLGVALQRVNVEVNEIEWT
ncbi:MAG: Asp23/Gls24 family envelope stress response protein [Candidatus Caldatribacteriaceae bacterium]